MNLVKKIFENKVFKNFTYLSASSLLSQAISLITIIKITGIMSPVDYGTYTFLLVQGTLILTVGDLGLRNIVIRTIARDPLQTANLTLHGAIIRVIGISALILPYWFYNEGFGSIGNSQLVLIFAYAITNCFSRLLETAYLGNQVMLPPAVINLAFSVLWFCAIVALPPGKIDKNYLFTAFTIVNAVKAAVFLYFLRRHRLLVGKINNFLDTSRQLLSQSWPYLLLVVIMLPFTHFSNNFLDLNSTSEQLAYFNLADRLIGPVSFVLDIALIALFPNLAALWVKNDQQFKQYVQLGVKYFMLLAVVFCFLFTLFIREAVTLLFPVAYLPAIIVCQYQIWYLCLSSVDYLIGTILGATNKETLILKLGITRTIISIPILYVASSYGAIGLSIGYISSFALFQIYLWFSFEKALTIKFKYTAKIWAFAMGLFVLSQVVSISFSMVYKVMIALSVVAVVVYKVLKRQKLSFAV